MTHRRVAAVVLPNLLCEIAEQRMGLERARQLLAVVEASGAAASGVAASGAAAFGVAASGPAAIEGGEHRLGDVLWAVNDGAYRCGIRAGQTVAEARALAAGLTLVGLAAHEARDALGRIAEVLFQFSPHVAIELGNVNISSDCVWLDVTGAAHLWGGEAALLATIAMRVQALGHRVRTAICDGPVLARAIALSTGAVESIVPSTDRVRAIERLPIAMLPLETELVSWLAKLGLWTFGDLRRIAARTALPRLGASADRVLALVQGHDDAPLVAYRPEDVLKESVEWDEPIPAIEPLLFALRGLTARLGARLEGRGEAARLLELLAPYDAGIAKCSGVDEASLSFRIELPSALLHEQDLFRVYKTKLERTVLRAPVTRVSIEAGLLVPAPVVQLEMGGDITVSTDPRAMSLLLAELSAQIGKDKVGILQVANVHEPEGKSLLASLDPAAVAHRASSSQEESLPPTESPLPESPLPSRLLTVPIPISNPPIRGGTIAIGRRIYTVRKVSHRVRLDGVAWWTAHPVHRDYVRVSLGVGNQSVEAWMFTDRITGRTYLHGYYD